MPLITASSYVAPGIFRNAHVNTIYPALFRRVSGVHYQRERLDTPDGDFLDLDWSVLGSDKLIVALHGLEGSTDRPYIRGMIRFFNRNGWDGLALNFRGCSGECNRLLRSYHMGETQDLQFVLENILAKDRYRKIALVGFSLGGNVLLKWLGERGAEARSLVASAVAFSVPCDIPSANIEIGKWHNALYVNRFLVSLYAKMQEKAGMHPEEVNCSGPRPRDFKDFDDRFTAPLHGFRNAEEYWESCSSLRFLPGVEVPTLLVNARDDTFLSRQCFPDQVAEKNPWLYLEIPRWGGHVGFIDRQKDEAIWSEVRALRFIRETTEN